MVLVDSRRESVTIPMEGENTVLSSSKPGPPFTISAVNLKDRGTSHHHPLLTHGGSCEGNQI